MSYKHLVATRLDDRDYEFLKKFTRLKGETISDALRYCVTVMRLVSEGSLLITVMPEFFFKEIRKVIVEK